MANSSRVVSLRALTKTMAYRWGWAAFHAGADRQNEIDALFSGHARSLQRDPMAYQTGRLMGAYAASRRIKLTAPTPRNAAGHPTLIAEAQREGAQPSRAITAAKMVQSALQELCGTIPPRKPMATLTFRRGLPVVPTFAEVNAAAAPAPATRRSKVIA